MKWIYAIQQKAQVAFLLALILFGVFVKNILERNNVSELGDSFSSVYTDRLLVESYIYQLSDQLYQKQILFDQCSQPLSDNNQLELKIKRHNATIYSLIHEYEKTKLTDQESVYFDEFKRNIKHMETLESQYLRSYADFATINTSLDQQFISAAGHLNQLSSIQIAEGKSMTDQSRKIVAGSTILTQFELAMIIIIGLIIQALIFASNSLTPKTFQNHQLN